MLQKIQVISIKQNDFDALQAAAENESGISGTLLSGGLGLGMGLGAGQQMANTVNQNTNNLNNNQPNGLDNRRKAFKN